MTEQHRVLVTGSRSYPNPAVIREVFASIAAAHPDEEICLVHGMCDPRHPVTNKRIPWETAVELPRWGQANLLGADWQADLAALELGWQVLARAADWKRHGRAAGRIRNAAMVNEDGPFTECRAFPTRCREPGCLRGRPHDSHGTAHCAALARQAGIRVETHPSA